MAVVSSAAAGRRAIERGATVLQLRAPLLSTRAIEAEAIALVASSSVPVLVSSRVDIVLAVRAAGVNLPESDIEVRDARSLLGDGLVGRSVHSAGAATEAARSGADFVIFGSVWPSPSHPDSQARGLDALAAVVRTVGIPVIAIGGVTPANAEECLRAGAAGFAGITMFQ